MYLNTDRFLSDRLLVSYSAKEGLRLSSPHSFLEWCKRILSWLWQPASYRRENRASILCFQKYLLDTLGEKRLQRICNRYDINLSKMAEEGSLLTTRTFAKIVVGTRCVNIQDVQDFLETDPHYQKWKVSDLDARSFEAIYKKLSDPFLGAWKVQDVQGRISGRPTERLADLWFDRFLADRERLTLEKEHHEDLFVIFLHNMVARVIKRELDVGDLIAAPKSKEGIGQFYVVSEKIISAFGMVSYVVRPAPGTKLPAGRFYRGTALRPSEIDAISGFKADLEYDLGKSAHYSGKPYKKYLSSYSFVAGHSLGSVLAQWEVLDNPDIRAAYLFCGPGLPIKEVQAFNRRPAPSQPIELDIRTVKGDRLRKTGGAHLGWKAPKWLKVHCVRYVPPKLAYGDSSHVTVWEKEEDLNFGIEGMPPERLNRHLYNAKKTTERIRRRIGPPLAQLLGSVRKVSRSLFSSRAEQLRGVTKGSWENPERKWRVVHFS